MRHLVKVYILLILVVVPEFANALDKKYISQGNAVPGFTCTTQDDDEYASYGSVSWKNQFINKSIKNRVTVKWDRNATTVLPYAAVDVYVDLDITYEYLDNATGILQPAVLRKHRLKLTNDTGRFAIDHDVSSKLFYNCVKVTVDVNGIVDGAGNVLIPGAPAVGTRPAIPLIILENEIQIERYYYDAVNTVAWSNGSMNYHLGSFVNVKLDHINASGWLDDVLITWPNMPHSEAYELEYLFVPMGQRAVDYSNFNTYQRSPFNAYEYSFRHNATRVRISGKSNYRIPNMFEAGFMLVRMRLIGKNPQDLSQEVYSDWTYPESGTIDFQAPYVIPGPASAPFLWGDGRISIPAFEGGKNWSVSTSYAEEGRQKTQVVYYDGSLRPRQTITRNNTLGYAMVGQATFDHEGKETASIPPAPTGDNLGYLLRPGFNQSAPGVPFDYTDYSLNSTSPGLTAEIENKPLDIGSGTAKYFSSNIGSIVAAIDAQKPAGASFSNYEKMMHNYVPNANGWVYAQTEYFNDGSGRVRRQGGIGEAHQLSGVTGGVYSPRHETRFGYETPSQFELDMLFGNEVGYAEHYKKIYSTDPNGETTVSYIDLKGRVIATAIVGAPAGSSLLPLSSSGHVVTAGETLKSVTTPGAHGGKVAKKSFSLTEPTVVQINYTLTPSQFTMDECPELCFDCKYKLRISLKDANGHEWMPNSNWINVGVPEVSLNTTCSSSYQFAYTPSPLVLNLPAGDYTLFKELQVDLDVLEQYKNLLLENATCLRNLEQFMTETVESVCQDCEVGCENCNTQLQAVATAIANTEDFCSANSIDPLTHPDLIELKYKQAQLKEQCSNLCDVKTPCQILYQAMISDVSPEGQYATTTLLNSNGEPMSGPVMNSLLNDQNGLSCNITVAAGSFNNVGVNWRNPIDPEDANATNCRNYKNPDGSIALIRVVDGLPEKKPGSSYVTISGDPNNYLKPQDLLHVRDFVNYWQESWARSLVVFHPEYCYYKKCHDIEPTYEYDLKLLNEPSGKEARVKGYFNPLGQTGLGTVTVNGTAQNISYTESGTVERDNTFVNGTGVFSASAFGQILTGITVKQKVNGVCVTENDVTIWELYEKYKALLGLDPLTDECASEVVWPYLRALYMMRKQQYLNLNYYNSCGGSQCGQTGGALQIALPRWSIAVNPEFVSSSKIPLQVPAAYRGNGSRSALNNAGNWSINEIDLCILDQSAVNAGGESDIATLCEDNCKGLANTWLEKLSECEILHSYIADPVNKQQLVADLAGVCKRGCDSDNPHGSLNVSPANMSSAPFKNIKEVFTHHLGTNWKSAGICDELLIDFPGYYGHDYTANYDPARDECVLEPNKHPGIDPNRCENEPGEIATDCSAQKSSTLAELNATLNGTIVNKKCENCIVCDDLEDATREFLEMYGNDYSASGPYLLKPAVYQNLLETWFNRKFGFNLTYEEYQDFATGCMSSFEPANWIDIWKTVAIKRKIGALLVPEIKIRSLHPEYLRQNDQGQRIDLQPNDQWFYLASTSEVAVYASSWAGTVAPHSSPAADQVACHCEKILNIQKLMNDGKSGGMTGEALFTQIYGTSWSLSHSGSFADNSEACCKLLKKRSLSNTEPCDIDDFQYGQKFPPDVKSHIDQELNMGWGSTILDKLRNPDNPCTPDNNNSETGYLDKCACKKLREMKDLWQAYQSGGGNLTFEAWVLMTEGVSGADLNQMDARCQKMWETGADKNRQGQTLPPYSSNVTWDLVGNVNLNLYAQQQDWLVPKKFKCPPGNVVVNPKDKTGGEGKSYVPPCLESIDCNVLKLKLKDFLLANLLLYPDPISADDLNSELTLPHVVEDILKKYNEITSGVDFVSNPANQPYIDFFNAFAAYLDQQMNHCQPFVAHDIHFWFRDKMNVFSCYLNFKITRPKTEPCEHCYEENKPFLLAFQNFLNQATFKNWPNQLYQTKWYLSPLPGGGLEDYPIFYNNNQLYNGSNVSDLRYFIQPGYSNTHMRVKITDGAYTMHFELNFPGFKEYYNFGEIKEFLDIEVPDVYNCQKDDFFTIKARIKVAPKYWPDPDYPELAVCPNELTNCYQTVTLTGRMYSHDLYTEVPCLGCGKLCNRSYAAGVPPEPDTCGHEELELGMDNALADYSNELGQKLSDFTNRYLRHCLQAAESLSTGRELNLHHFMLYYYDQSGALIKTVPPEGVDVDADHLTPAQRQTLAETRHAMAKTHRADSTAIRAIPEHWMISQYKFNSLGSPVWSKTPDGGENQIWYDEMGRMVLAQNSKQKVQSPGHYAYTRYDHLGRSVEGGVLKSYTLTSPRTASLVQDGFDLAEQRNYPGKKSPVIYSSGLTYHPENNDTKAETNGGKLVIGRHTINTSGPYAVYTDLNLVTAGAKTLSLVISDMVSGGSMKVYADQFQAGSWMNVYTSAVISVTGSHSLSIPYLPAQVRIRLEHQAPSGTTPMLELDQLTVEHQYNEFAPYPEFVADQSAINPAILAADKQEVNVGIYDVSSTIGGLSAVMGDQQNLRNRVASQYYFTKVPAAATSGGQTDVIGYVLAGSSVSGYTQATHYSYDIHGNANTVVQDYPELGKRFDKRFYSFRYSYDLISGLTHQVAYQKPQDPDAALPVDAFVHKYIFDQDNVLKEVLTSSDGWHWESDARYSYYLHGALMRRELGALRVQGIDYAHTIEGWQKAANGANIGQVNVSSGAITAVNDMGADGVPTGPHAEVARDAFGFTLSYYQGDYQPANPMTANPEPAMVSGAGLPSDFGASMFNLYNGNIRGMQVCLPDIAQYASPARKLVSHTLGFSYRHDQLNRLKSFGTYDNLDYATNHWNNTTPPQSGMHRYHGSFSYDKMGNITQLARLANQTYPGSAGPIGNMDDLTYHYSRPGGKLQNNKLLWVDDAITTAFAGDIEDQSSGNYTYDQLGNLNSDVSAEIGDIQWTTTGKVREINRTTTSTKPDLELIYGVGDRRIARLSKPRKSGTGGLTEQEKESGWTYTWYVHDQNGSVMATYTGNYEYQQSGNQHKVKLKLDETYLYGSSRLGSLVADRVVSEKQILPPVYEGQYFSDLTWGSMAAQITQPEAELNLQYHGSVVAYDPTPFAGVKRGKKRYELVNHLRNVLAVITDRKLPVSNVGGNLAYFQPFIRLLRDYEPFGSELPGRSLEHKGDKSYNFGFNGQEHEATLGEYYIFEFRIHDARLGRFLSVDPLEAEYPWNSTYAFAENDLIRCVDLEGLEKLEVNIIPSRKNGYPILTVHVKVLEHGVPLSSAYNLYDFDNNIIATGNHTLGQTQIIARKMTEKSVKTNLTTNQFAPPYILNNVVVDGITTGSYTNTETGVTNPTTYRKIDYIYYEDDWVAPTFTRNGTMTTIVRNPPPPPVIIPAVNLNTPFNSVGSPRFPGAFVNPALANAEVRRFVAGLPAGTTAVNVTVSFQGSGPTSPVAPNLFGLANAAQVLEARANSIRRVFAGFGIVANVRTLYTPTVPPAVTAAGVARVIPTPPTWTITKTPIAQTFRLNPDGTFTPIGDPVKTGAATSRIIGLTPGTPVPSVGTTITYP